MGKLVDNERTRLANWRKWKLLHRRWLLLQEVLANSRKWVNHYGPGPQRDACRTLVRASMLLTLVRREIPDAESSWNLGSSAKRVWDDFVILHAAEEDE